MILLDFSNLIHQSVHAKQMDVSQEHIRALIFSIIRGVKKKFSAKYGRLVICVDHRENWRKDFFPEYKYRRKLKRKTSGIDWKSVYEWTDEVIKDLREHFPYQVIEIPKVEADDIIAVISQSVDEKVLICSADGDMKQLLVRPNIELYSLHSKTMVTEDDVSGWLLDTILRGQSKDDVPNVRSEITHFVDGVGNQKPITPKFVREIKEHGLDNVLDEKQMKRFKQNKTILDLTAQPFEIRQAIYQEFKKPYHTDNKTIYKYFMQNQMPLFVQDVPHFIEN